MKAVRRNLQNDILLPLTSNIQNAHSCVRILVYMGLYIKSALVVALCPFTCTNFLNHAQQQQCMFHVFKKTTSFHHIIKAERQKAHPARAWPIKQWQEAQTDTSPLHPNNQWYRSEISRAVYHRAPWGGLILISIQNTAGPLKLWIASCVLYLGLQNVIHGVMNCVLNQTWHHVLFAAERNFGHLIVRSVIVTWSGKTNIVYYCVILLFCLFFQTQ